MKALEDLFPGKKGMAIIIISPQGVERHGAEGGGEDVEIPIGASLGTPYSWGGAIPPDGRGDDDIPLDEPSDCSSFIANLIAALTGDGVKLPALTDAMIPETEPVEPGDEQEGDLLFSKYNGQGPIDYGHVSMLMDKQGETPDEWLALEQSTAPGLITGRPGVDIRRADHAIDQGGEMIVRRPITGDFFRRARS